MLQNHPRRGVGMDEARLALRWQLLKVNNVRLEVLLTLLSYHGSLNYILLYTFTLTFSLVHVCY